MKIIAIDGPAGAGKGTIARYLAEKFGYPHIDTGLFYRALAIKAINNNIDHDQVHLLVVQVNDITLSDLSAPNIRNESIAGVASKISVHPEIRQMLTKKIQDLAMNLGSSCGGVILDGRDVGTVIFPNADIKLFITAQDDVRFQRRLYEMGEHNINIIKDSLISRDIRDQNRQTAPLVKAKGAITIDTTHLSITDACDKAYHIILG